MKIVARLFAPLLLLAAAGCGDFLVGSRPGGEFQQRKLAENRALWESRGPASYQYTLDVVCDCILQSLQQPVRVTVRDGVDSYEYVQRDTASPVEAPAGFAHFTSVEKLFTRIEEWIPRRKILFQVWYDRDLGFPETMNVVFSGDRNEQIIVMVTDFRAL
jgi:hypothetical protein